MQEIFEELLTPFLCIDVTQRIRGPVQEIRELYGSSGVCKESPRILDSCRAVPELSLVFNVCLFAFTVNIDRLITFEISVKVQIVHVT